MNAPLKRTANPRLQEEKSDFVFRSERCTYREFGLCKDGSIFFEKYPGLANDLLQYGTDHVLSDDYNRKLEIREALNDLPEFQAYLGTVLQRDFFYAGFGQTERVAANDHKTGLHKTGVRDVADYVLNRIRSQMIEPREKYEFVAQNENGEIIGCVELFNRQELEGGKVQYERALFINPFYQGKGYGKEVIIALTDFAFQRVGIDQIETTVDPDNEPSLNNIKNNSGGVFQRTKDSPYAGLNGGGHKRHVYHIYPGSFYASVSENQNAFGLMQQQFD